MADKKSSLVILVGNSKADDYDAYEFAELADVKFIQLRHKRGVANGFHAIRGFQGVKVIISESREGGVQYRAEFSRSTDGRDIRALRPLVFEPEGRTKLLTAYVPDSPFNREKLAKDFYHGLQCNITDAQILAEVRARADEIEAGKPVEPSREEVIASQDDEIKILREQLKAKEQENEELKERNEVIQTAKRVVKELPEDIRQAVTDIVHQENEGVVSKLKEQSPNGWQKTKKYKTLILPIIEKREKEELERMNNAEHSGTRIND